MSTEQPVRYETGTILGFKNPEWGHYAVIVMGYDYSHGPACTVFTQTPAGVWECVDKFYEGSHFPTYTHTQLTAFEDPPDELVRASTEILLRGVTK